MPVLPRLNGVEPFAQAWVNVAWSSCVNVPARVLGSTAVIWTGESLRTWTVDAVPLKLQTLNPAVLLVVSITIWKGE